MLAFPTSTRLHNVHGSVTEGAADMLSPLEHSSHVESYAKAPPLTVIGLKWEYIGASLNSSCKMSLFEESSPILTTSRHRRTPPDTNTVVALRHIPFTASKLGVQAAWDTWGHSLNVQEDCHSSYDTDAQRVLDDLLRDTLQQCMPDVCAWGKQCHPHNQQTQRHAICSGVSIAHWHFGLFGCAGHPELFAQKRGAA
ncbi:hypothetical protein HPB50_003348 [Hyalomma asiaticum]|uniref:Uncharacterized protein n=1 Tax=Hyalomma asiaticum TaxID=266040 RepID=A0ACB7TE98_HYAAI|nr:hypothetical protein HPB50_003348 [Hyalomma asiaticum]